ncbi:MAG: winged helix-turn-helix domain-containing protein [Lachnospiraceae bacterium]|nr:winged helix-turn-helix domain-containing protein [Lachnospiraceae bacterium]
MMILTFKDSEEALLKRLIDSLGILEYQQVDLPAEPLLQIGTLSLHPLESRIEHDGISYTLGRQQFQILYLLARNPGRTFQKTQIYSMVWEGTEPIQVNETIRYHISELRKILLELTGKACIETVWGVGYRFVE